MEDVGDNHSANDGLIVHSQPDTSCARIEHFHVGNGFPSKRYFNFLC